jgi:hypothetical protein
LRRGAQAIAARSTRFPIVRGSDIDGHGWSAGNTLNPRQIMELEMERAFDGPTELVDYLDYQ